MLRSRKRIDNLAMAAKVQGTINRLVHSMMDDLKELIELNTEEIVKIRRDVDILKRDAKRDKSKASR